MSMADFSAYLDVAVSLPVYRTYTYGVPDHLIDQVTTGKRVLVFFGNRRVTGIILEQRGKPESKNIKPILDILDPSPLFPASMIPFFKWIAEYYIHPIGEVIRTALPGGLTLTDRTEVALTDWGRRALDEEKPDADEAALMNQLRTGPRPYHLLLRTPDPKQINILVNTLEERGWIHKRQRLSGGGTRQRTERFVILSEDFTPPPRFSSQRRKIVDILRIQKEVSVAALKEEIPTAAALVRSMGKQGQVRVVRKPVFRDPFGEAISPDTAPRLNPEQHQALNTIVTGLGRGYGTFLLSGVTGSGKTEVYLRAAAEAIRRDVSVLVLVPEIVLISQMERRFRARFGDCIAVLHSGLTAGERYDQWIRISQGHVKIAIGVRSAIFAPMDRIGLIVVDEEHDGSYKQEGGLRYNARDLAVVRARQQEAIAVLGSATPSIQSYDNARREKYSEISLPSRVEKRPLPAIEVIDLRDTRDVRGIRRFITPVLIEAISQSLKKNEQTLLFLNRRGFASYPVCGSCGEAIRCRNCDISLTLHRGLNTLRCHFCGYSQPFQEACPSCNASRIRLLGMGTEKVEAAVKDLFPSARVARMDRDTTRRKGAIVKLLKGLRDGSIDVLVGTQMVAKGHDFPNITLVGIICADLSLNFPDFRSGERTFQLLAQVAGRAGRGDAPGRVILQTYNPDHFCITAARLQDFRKFYTEEITFRKSLEYPPFTRMIQLRISGKGADETESQARLLGDRIRYALNREPFRNRSIQILGPIESPLAKLANRYRWQILIKGSRQRELHGLAMTVLFDKTARQIRNVKIVADVDPVFMM